MNAVTHMEDASESLPQSPTLSETAAIIQVIERAAMNPNVDIDKMERLLQMQERIMSRNAKSAYVAALAQMSPELPVIKERGGIKDKAGNIQSRYALWEDINDAIKPVMAKHGFALSFRTGRTGDQIMVTGVLSHRDGHSEETTMHLPVDGSGSKNAVQAVGSSTSYGKRYTAQALLNLTSRDGGEKDDDGKAAGAPLLVTEDQVSQILELMAETRSNMPIFLKYMGIEKIEDVPAAKFEGVIKKFNIKKAEQAKGGANG